MNRLSFYAVVTFFFTLPWQDVVRLPGSSALSVSRLAGLALIVAVLAGTLQRGTVRLRVPAVTLILTCTFCIWAVAVSIGNLWSPGFAVTKALTYAQLAVMSVIVWQLCRTREEHATLLQAFVLGAYVLAGRIVYEYIVNPFVPTSTQSMQRYAGFGDEPNVIAATMALALPVAWFLGSFVTRGLWRWINLVYVPVAIMGIILTASRGGFVTALVGLLIVPLTYRFHQRTGRIAVLVGAMIVIGVLAAVVPVANFNRVAETSTELSEGNVSNRSQIWRAGLELYQQSPIIGIGTGSFNQAIEPLLGYDIAAHNAFVNILVETGIVGFVLFTLNFIIVLLPLLQLGGTERPFYGIFWIALVISMLPSNVEDSQVVWALLTLIATRRAYTVKLPGLADEDEPGPRLPIPNPLHQAS